MSSGTLNTALRAILFFGAIMALTHGMEASADSGTAQRVRNVILVHGAWADGSSWSKVIPLLVAKGLHVVAVQIHLNSLEDDVATTKRAIALRDGRVVLVGHSYGGAVITEAGNDPKVAGLVYVAAFAPGDGESVNSISKPYPPAPLGAELRPDAQGFLWITPKGFAEDFGQDLSDSEKAVFTATQGPANAAAFGGTITNAAWKTKPSWFVVAGDDRAIPPALEKAEASRMKATAITLPSSHLAMLSHPNEVADIIGDATKGSAVH
jgi:pimeloyl-ACP methyl ester carboxylesterase